MHCVFLLVVEYVKGEQNHHIFLLSCSNLMRKKQVLMILQITTLTSYRKGQGAVKILYYGVGELAPEIGVGGKG